MKSALLVVGHGSRERAGTEEFLRFVAASRAAMAVGHSILVIICHLLRDGTDYTDLGPHYFVQRDRQCAERRLVRQLKGLGYTVTLDPCVA